MKAFIFDTTWHDFMTPTLENRLKESGIEAIAITELAPISDCKALFEGDDERILCVNPDYVNFELSVDDYKDIPNLKAILGSSIATTWIDKSYADNNGIAVLNTRSFPIESMAQWAIAVLLNLASQVPKLISDGFPMETDEDYMKYQGIELRSRKVGIVGLATLGSTFAQKCDGLGMKVIYWSRFPQKSKYKAVDLEQLMAESDIIFIATALSDKNDKAKTILTDDLLLSMKNTAIFISILHDDDGLLNLKLILDMVKNNKLFGFGFPAEEFTFYKYEGNVWATPNYGGNTDVSVTDKKVQWIENMIDAATTLKPNSIINSQF